MRYYVLLQRLYQVVVEFNLDYGIFNRSEGNHLTLFVFD